MTGPNEERASDFPRLRLARTPSSPEPRTSQRLSPYEEAAAGRHKVGCRQLGCGASGAKGSPTQVRTPQPWLRLAEPGPGAVGTVQSWTLAPPAPPESAGGSPGGSSSSANAFPQTTLLWAAQAPQAPGLTWPGLRAQWGESFPCPPATQGQGLPGPSTLGVCQKKGGGLKE